MQLLTSLIGGSGNMYLNAALALGVVLVLIVLGLWALKLVFRASTTVVRGGRRRLAIVDVLPVDGKRQLLIVRRDNVEHLLLTGGPQDVVIETGFAAEAAQVLPVRPPVAPRTQQRPAPSPAPAAAAAAVAASHAMVPVGLQRAPMPHRAEPPEPISAMAPAAMPGNDHNPVRESLERLREFNRPASPRRPSLLRHTGLLRPVSRLEPALIPANMDNSARPHSDSATTGRVTPLSGPHNGNGQALGRDVFIRQEGEQEY